MEVRISEKDAGLSIKDFLLREKFSARLITRLKAKENGILVDGERKTVRYVLKEGDLLSLEVEDSHSSDTIPLCHKPIEILYEDDWYIAVKKDAHMPIHPSRRHLDDTLASRVMAHFEGKNFVFRVMTRLDIDTSGVVIIAKDSISATRFSKLLEKREVKKEYLAICHGIFDEKSGVIDYNIRRPNPFDIRREAVDKAPSGSENSASGTEAISLFEVVKEKGHFSLVSLSPVTGRTHQLRVHLNKIGHPILSDTLYHTSSPYIERQALHAHRLSFVHPFYEKTVTITCPLPSDMAVCERILFDEETQE